MKLYVVRQISDKQIVGFFYCEDAAELADYADEASDTHDCEYQIIDGSAYLIWTGYAPSIGEREVPSSAFQTHYDEFRAGVEFEGEFGRHMFKVNDEPWTPLAETMGLGKVYFIRSGPHIKIGFTAGEVSKRMASLATSTANDLELLATIGGASRRDERDLHERFSHLRVRREWFNAGEDLLAYIASVSGEVE